MRYLTVVLLCLVVPAEVCAVELRVVATIPLVADLTKQIAGDRARVESLAPAGVMLHVWQPAPSDVVKLADAKLVIRHGLGMDTWLDAMVTASGYRGPTVDASTGIVPRADKAHTHAHGGTHAHSHAQAQDHAHDIDPHVFHDVRNALISVKLIRDALIAADPAGKPYFEARADLVLGQLTVLDAWVRRQVAQIPAQRRVLVMTHEALGYFAAAYGFTLHVAEGVGHGQEPGLQKVEELIGDVREWKLRSVFSEVGQPEGVLRGIAQATGATIAGPIAGDGPLAGQSYTEMITANTLMIVEGLK